MATIILWLLAYHTTFFFFCFLLPTTQPLLPYFLSYKKSYDTPSKTKSPPIVATTHSIKKKYQKEKKNKTVRGFVFVWMKYCLFSGWGRCRYIQRKDGKNVTSTKVKERKQSGWYYFRDVRKSKQRQDGIDGKEMGVCVCGGANGKTRSIVLSFLLFLLSSICPPHSCILL